MSPSKSTCHMMDISHFSIGFEHEVPKLISFMCVLGFFFFGGGGGGGGDTLQLSLLLLLLLLLLFLLLLLLLL